MIINFNFISIITLTLINFSIFLFINFILRKTNYLLDDANSSHHKKIADISNVPLSGGIVLILNCFYLNLVTNFFNIFYLAVIYFIGVMSDTQKINSPSIRFFFQALIILIFLANNDYLITSVRISHFDYLLNNYKYLSIVFTFFCLLILINGSNFIDGVNLQSSGYYVSLIFTLLLLYKNTSIEINANMLQQIIIFLLIFISFNFFNKSFMGDGGIYLISFIIGLILIELQNKTFISPYFIALLLWYPAFENFFSILRKILIDKKSPSEPDKNHLHHLLFFYINQNFNFPKILTSSLTGIFINIFNLSIFLISLKFVYLTIFQVSLIILCIFVYTLSYFLLRKYKIKLQNN